MFRYLLRLATLLVLSSVILAQPDTLWTRLYDASDFDFAFSVQQTTDGGFVIAGYQGPDYQVRLVKTDSAGNQLWSYPFGPLGSYGYDVQQTSDGGYIMAGYAFGNSTGVLVKTDSYGAEQWVRSFGGHSSVSLNHVREDGNGNFVAIGTVRDASRSRILVEGVSHWGDTLWSHIYGPPNDSVAEWSAQAICPIPGTDFMVAGVVDSMYVGDQDILVLRITGAGDTLWSRTYELPGIQFVEDVRPTHGGYLIIANGNYCPAIVKIDYAGGSVSVRNLDSLCSVDCATACELPSGDLLVAGTAFGGSPGWPNFSLSCVSPVDTLLWQEYYGGPNNEFAEDMKMTSDGGCIMVGRTASFGAGGWDFYAVRTGPVEEPYATPAPRASPLSLSLANFPNPFNPSTEIRFDLPRAERVRLTVFDVLGKQTALLKNGMVEAGSHAVLFDGAALPSGVYFARLEAGGAVRTQKMVLLK